MEAQEVQAISACQSGDLSQFTVLYERYVNKIYRFVYFKTFHRETAEDLTAQSFMKALEHIRDFDTQRGNFSSWLYCIAYNTVIDHYRTVKHELDIDAMFDLASPLNVTEVAQLNLAIDKVKEYMRGLEREIQDLLIMRLWQGLSYQEIAAITGKSEGALKMSASRALRQLRTKVSLSTLALIIMSLR